MISKPKLMLSAIEFNKTMIQNHLNGTSFIGNKQENTKNNDMQFSNSRSNNQPLLVLGGCLSFVIICVLFLFFLNKLAEKKE